MEDKNKIPNADENLSADSTDIEQETNTIPQDEINGKENVVESEFRYIWDENARKKAKAKQKRKETRRVRIFAATMSILTVVSVTALVVMMAYGIGPQYNGGNNSYPYVSGVSDIESETSGEYSRDEVSFPEFTADVNKGEDDLPLQHIAEKLNKSTVTVYCTGESSTWGGASISFGSGFVISDSGYIVTNHHVIDGAKTITVIFYDDTEYEAKLVGSDSLYDIAVLKIEGEKFIPAELGSSDDLVVGDMVIAIGTPYSLELAGTHTFGFISATDRKVKVTSGTSVVKTMTMLQTDATLNSGNSGGPLVNMKGQVIGINTMKLVSDYEGIGFAIPMSNAVDIINQLIEKGVVTNPDGSVTASPYLGVQVADVTESDSKLYDVPMGALVTYIETSGSAYKAGMRRNDIITEFAGEKIESVDDLLRVLNRHKAGDKVSVKVYRGEKTTSVSFKLDPRKD